MLQENVLEFRELPELPGSGVQIGHEGFRAWWAELLDAFEELRFEAEEFGGTAANRFKSGPCHDNRVGHVGSRVASTLRPYG